MSSLDKNLKLVKPKDLIFVILYGGVLPVMVGIAFALVDYYLTNLISFSLYMLFFFIGAQFIGIQVRKQYEMPHLLYSIITAVFTVIMGLMIYFLPFVYADAIYYNDYKLLFSISYYLDYIWYYLRVLFTTFDFILMLNVLILGVGTYLAVRRTI